MTIKTVFSGNVTELEQLPDVFSRFNEWSVKQDRNGWTRSGSFLSFSKDQQITFNSFVVNDSGLSTVQKDEVIQIFQTSGLHIITTATNPHPATK